MLSKESKMKVLENFYGVDYVFFGKPLSKVKSCCPVIKEEYITVKGALLSIYIEMLNLIDHRPPQITEVLTSRDIKYMAKDGARFARRTSKKIVTTEKARKDIKMELTGVIKEGSPQDLSTLVEEKIREKAYSLAIDTLMIARTLIVSKNIKEMNTWEGKIIEDSYKILRDSLCETAILILSD